MRNDEREVPLSSLVTHFLKVSGGTGGLPTFSESISQVHSRSSLQAHSLPPKQNLLIVREPSDGPVQAMDQWLARQGFSQNLGGFWEITQLFWGDD